MKRIAMTKILDRLRVGILVSLMLEAAEEALSACSNLIECGCVRSSYFLERLRDPSAVLMQLCIIQL